MNDDTTDKFMQTMIYFLNINNNCKNKEKKQIAQNAIHIFIGDASKKHEIDALIDDYSLTKNNYVRYLKLDSF